MAANIFPNITLQDLLWRIPMVTLGYLLVQAGRKAGIKGIGRTDKSIALWKRFSELHKEELEEERKRKAIN